MFRLDPRLAADTVAVAALPLCDVRLMNDARFPWLVLVPRLPDAVEIVDLRAVDQHALWGETDRAARALRTVSAPLKLNIGALGNIVRQLHVHVVARFEGDAAWPGPVWGSGPAQPYAAPARDALLVRLRTELGEVA